MKQCETLHKPDGHIQSAYTYWAHILAKEMSTKLILLSLCCVRIMYAVKFISCEQIHLKVQFILSIMNTNSIETVKTD